MNRKPGTYYRAVYRTGALLLRLPEPGGEESFRRGSPGRGGWGGGDRRYLAADSGDSALVRNVVVVVMMPRKRRVTGALRPAPGITIPGFITAGGDLIWETGIG